MKATLISNFKRIKNKDGFLNLCNKIKDIFDEIYADISVKENYESIGLDFNFNNLDDSLKNSDLLIVVGGDGTVLHAAKSAAKYNIPILSINSGRVGYLTDLELDDYELISKIKSGNYVKEKRMMLDVKISSKDDSFIALNDAVISRGTLSRMVDFSISCNGIKSLMYRADGVIFATPTGSSAYSLSAGGPLLDPCVKSISVTPICPHSLFSRTVVFDPSNELKLSFPESDNKDVYLTIDGEDAIKLNENDVVTVKESKIFAEFIRIKNDQFCHIVGKKMIEKGI